MYRYYSLILSLFVTALLVANTISVKVFQLGYVALPAGIILYPMVSVMGDVLTEVYGYAAVRKAIWCGFTGLLIMNISYAIAIQLPPSPYWQHDEAFGQILGTVPRVTIASLLSYPVGEFINAYLLAKLKAYTNGKFIKLRFVVSTLGGQGLDSFIFVTVAFSFVLPIQQLVITMTVSWLVKVMWEVSALPVSIRISKFLKDKEGIDVFDRQTNFSPIYYS